MTNTGTGSLTILGPLAPLAMQESANASPPTGTTPSPTAETETDSGSRPEGSSPAVFFCSHCSAPTRPVEASGQRFYAVIRGLEVGVFEGWRVFSTLKILTSLTRLILRATVRHLVQNPDNLDISIPGIRTQVFSTRIAAEERFAEALASGEVVKMSV